MNGENQPKNKSVVPFILTFIALTAASIVFGILCIYATKIAFFANNPLLFSILASVLLAVLCAFSVWFVLKGKELFYKGALSAFILIVFALVVLFILQTTGFFEVIRDENSLKEYIAAKGAWMPVVYVVLQYLQVIILPIPSVVSTLAGVALFGPFQTTVYSLIGVLLGSFTAFIIGKKLGNKAVEWLIGKETLEKWQKKIKGKDYLLLTLMFILPVFPDDVLCFVAGLSTMSLRYFAVMIVISRILQISVTCYSIDLIPWTTWWGLLIWIVFFAVLLVAFIYVSKNLDKIQKYITERFSKNKKK